MGIRVKVYRDNGPDCSNDGFSAYFNEFTVVNIEGPSEPDNTAPAVLLVDKRETGKPNPKIVPADDYGKGAWLMFGGNYAGTGDSRFADALEKLTGVRMSIVKIHDRREW